MSTSATVGAPTGAATAFPRVPFSRHVKVELRKMVDTRAGLWLLIAIAAVTLIPEGVYVGVAHSSDLTLDNALGAAGFGQTLLLPVLGVLSITSEFSQRTGLVTFTLEPHRTRLISAKTAAVILLSVILVAISYFTAIIGNEASNIIRGSGDWHYAGSWVFEVLLAQLLVVIVGFGLGMVFVNSAAAIVLYYVGRIIIPTLFAIIPGIIHADPWLDFVTPTGNLFSHEMSGPKPWLEVGTVFLIWVVLPFTIGAWRLNRTEVKSA
jgi:ABC-2 type transport system permease protein